MAVLYLVLFLERFSFFVATFPGVLTRVPFEIDLVIGELVARSTLVGVIGLLRGASVGEVLFTASELQFSKKTLWLTTDELCPRLDALVLGISNCRPLYC